jgi:hypothetical protein
MLVSTEELEEAFEKLVKDEENLRSLEAKLRVQPKHGSISTFQGNIEYLSEEDAWERDFCRNKDLSRNLGEAPSRIFKSRSGNFRHQISKFLQKFVVWPRVKLC